MRKEKSSVRHRRFRISRAAFTAALQVCLLASCTSEKSANWTRNLPVVERAPRAQELLAYPEDQKAIGVNPPGFTWTPHDQAKAYRLEIRGVNDRSNVRLPDKPLTSTSCPLSRPLEPGNYEWQIVYISSTGESYGVSQTRRFSVAAGLPELPMPDVAELRTKLVAVRPRMFLAGDRLKQIRAAVEAGKVPLWEYFLKAANGALREPSYPEPEPYPGGKESIEHHRRVLMIGKVASAHLARTALAYKITGDRKYLQGARRWLMTLASWNPRGIVSHDVPQPDGTSGADAAAMPVLRRMSLAWDWIGDELTPEERAKVLAVIPERGDQILRLLHKQDFLSVPFENHEGRALARLGEAGLSFLGDIPEAEEWLDYTIRCFLTSYPSWGGDEGGWAQGVAYWTGYVARLTYFIEALREVSDVDLLRRPFFRNTGYFALYFHPPYAKLGAFGDGGENGPSGAEGEVIDFFATTLNDPVLKWHVKALSTAPASEGDTTEVGKWRANVIEDVASILRAGKQTPQSKAPVDLDGSRYFPDIGWVAMHSALGNAEDDVWALFKSSRFGSFSHSHGDQNTFQLNAYGEALAIDSGYYPWYGSPHHVLWSRQTRAHNGILVNRRGQPPFNWDASGKIELYEHRGPITVARGQAAEAYNLPMRENTARLWQRLLKEPLPPMDPKVQTFERTLAFVASKSRPVLFIYDQLRTDSPTTFDWMLHALERMQFRQEPASLTLRSGRARLAVRLLSTQPFQFSQTELFPIQPEERRSGAANQWHLAARSRPATNEIKFLAVMAPYRASEREPEITPVKTAESAGFRVAGTEVVVWWGPGEKGTVRLADWQGNARMALRVGEAGETYSVVCP